MLRDILANLQDSLGVSADRARLVRFVNQAYKEYYQRTDLPGSLLEQIFEFSNGDQVATLPWYVGEVRALRRAVSRQPITMHDMAPRYHTKAWRQQRWEFRLVGRRAIHTPLSVESQLTIAIPIAQADTFSVTIKGQTPSAASITETLTFAPGELSKTTTAQFAKDDPAGIEAITRSGAVTADITIADAAGVELALLPNSQENSEHIHIQWNDSDTGQHATTDNNIEILYKRRYTPLTLDTDVCIFTPIEDAICWKARSYHYSFSKDELAGQQAVLASQKADELFAQATQTRDMETVAVIQQEPNPYERSWDGGWQIWRSYR